MKPFTTAAVITALLASSTQGFAPSVTTSTFVTKKTVSTSAGAAVRQNGSALSMNLFDRFQRVAKANINNALKNMEDPEKILNQALEDMQGDLVKVRQSYAEVTATQRRLLKQKEQADAIAEDWYQRAQLALQKGNEELAREALSRRQAQTDTATDLQNQIDAQNGSIDKLYEGMQMLESKIMEAKAKKEQYIARARTAESTQKVNDMLSGVTGTTSMDAFNRMEEKVEALEAKAEVSAEMGSMNALPGSAGGDLEKQFKMLEGESAVEDELAKMKGLLGGSSDAPSASASPAKKNDGLDDEMAKLKRDAGL
jgi:phage shock protein A